MKYLSILFIALALSSCKTYSDEDLDVFDQEIQDYISENELDLKKTSSGMYYSIEDEGEGPLIKFTDVISFKYRGELLDGTEFDNQLEEPVEFEVNQLIGAWKEIMLNLRKGGKAYLITPPSLGYGTHDLDDIPPNSVLIFEMEVIDVK